MTRGEEKKNKQKMGSRSILINNNSHWDSFLPLHAFLNFYFEFLCNKLMLIYKFIFLFVCWAIFAIANILTI